MRIEPERVLVIAPHTDDAEVSSGGTISRFVREGRDVHVLVLASASAENPQIPLDEFWKACDLLEVEPVDAGFMLPVRHFPEFRQQILEKFLDVRKQLKPDLVIIPSLRDMHQDHQVAAEEALRAFKNGSTILGFEYPWNNVVFQTTCYIKINEDDLEKKIAAIAEYKSQQKHYLAPEVIRAWAITRGVAIQSRYAESFEVVRLVV